MQLQRVSPVPDRGQHQFQPWNEPAVDELEAWEVPDAFLPKAAKDAVVDAPPKLVARNAEGQRGLAEGEMLSWRSFW